MDYCPFFLSIRGWQDLFLLMPSDSSGAWVSLVSNCAFPSPLQTLTQGDLPWI